jgi:hypothetical protein
MTLSLISDWKNRLLRLWSVRLLALSTAWTAFLWSSPDTVIAVLTQVPVWLRVALILCFFAVRLAARLVRQRIPEAADGAETA